MTSPHTHALRFRIWQYAESRSWDVTTHEIAEHIGETHRTVVKIVADRGWLHRLRTTRVEFGGLVYRDTTMPLVGDVLAGRMGAFA